MTDLQPRRVRIILKSGTVLEAWMSQAELDDLETRFSLDLHDPTPNDGGAVGVHIIGNNGRAIIDPREIAALIFGNYPDVGGRAQSVGP